MYYDKIYAHPERPEDDIIDDDSRLDAWLTNQQAQVRANRNQSKASGSGHSRRETFTPIA
jgi:hypothetical protein